MVANELFLFSLSLFQYYYKIMDFHLFCVLPTITEFFLMLKMSPIWPVGAL